MKLLNELLTLSEAAKGTTLVGLTIGLDRLITDKTKDEIWNGNFQINSWVDKTGRSMVRIPSLEGSPKEVTGHFNCSELPELTSLKGAPEKVGLDFDCDDNPKLASLEGCPKEVGRDFRCSDNPKLTSLKDIHKQITRIGDKFIAKNTPIKSHVLGLLLIKDCTGVKLANKKVQSILNKYLPNTRGNKGLIDCQSELLDADLEDYAEL